MAAGPRFRPRKLVTLIGRNIVEFDAFWLSCKALEIRHDCPAVSHSYTARITGHGAEAIGHDVKEVAVRRLPQAVDVVRRGLAKAAQDDHSAAVTRAAVADRAKDVEAFAPARQQRPAQFSRVGFVVGTVEMPAISLIDGPIRGLERTSLTKRPDSFLQE